MHSQLVRLVIILLLPLALLMLHMIECVLTTDKKIKKFKNWDFTNKIKKTKYRFKTLYYKQIIIENTGILVRISKLFKKLYFVLKATNSFVISS